MGISLTYGNMPTWAEFSAAFETNIGVGSVYNVQNTKFDLPVIASGDYDAGTLYAELLLLVAEWQSGDGEREEECGNMAAGILETLGFEWI